MNSISRVKVLGIRSAVNTQSGFFGDVNVNSTLYSLLVEWSDGSRNLVECKSEDMMDFYISYIDMNDTFSDINARLYEIEKKLGIEAQKPKAAIYHSIHVLENKKEVQNLQEEDTDPDMTGQECEPIIEDDGLMCPLCGKGAQKPETKVCKGCGARFI